MSGAVPLTPPTNDTSGARRLVLHVGPHKTASTYIQENLTAARAALWDAGWLYPEDPVDNRSGHHGLGRTPSDYLAHDAPHRAVLDGWASAVEQSGHNMVLSTEELCRWGRDDLDRLADTLGFTTYEVAYVIRDPLDLFPSLWAEEVKHGHTIGLADRFARLALQPLTARIFNPMHDLRTWLENDRVRVRAIPFDTLKTRNMDIFEHLTGSVLNLPGLRVTKTKPVNRKYPLEVTEFLRLITLMHHGGQTKCGPDLRMRFSTFLTPNYIRDIKALMINDARHARRNIPIHANQGFQKTLEASLRRHLSQSWTLEITTDMCLFSYEKRVFPYYNEFVLQTVDPVRKAADAILAKMYA
ncbi:MAG: hypothetical protein AAFY25_12325 [Pseudomonadota bacterium]